MATETKRAGRWLLSIVIAVVAAAMILYGITQIVLSASLSDKNMHALANELELEEYMDKPALVKTLNTVIYKWTNAFSSSSIYATEDTLSNFYDEAQVKDFIGDVFCKIATSLKTGKPLNVTTEEMVPLTETLRQYVSGKLGEEITTEQCAEELNNAVSLKKLNVPFPHLVRLGLGIALIVIAVALLAVMLFVRRENLFMGGFYLALSFGVPAIAHLIAAGALKASDFAISYFPVIRWVEYVRHGLKTSGIICLVLAVAGIALMIAYLIDKKRVKDMTANRRKEADIL